MSWGEVEYGDGDLGDPRRTHRLIQIAEARAERPSASLPQGFASAAAREGADALCENALIDLADSLAGHFGATARRMVAEPLVLALADPTEVDESEHSATRGLGMAPGYPASGVADPYHAGGDAPAGAPGADRSAADRPGGGTVRQAASATSASA